MFEEVVFYLILLVSCIVCARAMSSPSSSSPSHRLPQTKYEGTEETGTSLPPIKPLPKWRPFQLKADVIVCSCGQSNPSEAEICWSCDRGLASAKTQILTVEAAERCDVCAYWIYPGDRVAICPACKAQGHYAHLHEYVRAKGQCPRCNRKLVTTQLLIASTIHDQPVDAVLTESNPQ